jgi:hypothetical protein
LRGLKAALLTICEVVTYGSLLLLLPSVVVGLLFDFRVVEFLAYVMLAAVAGTAIMTGLAIHEGWYLEHLANSANSQSTPGRREPTLGGTTAGDQGD